MNELLDKIQHVDIDQINDLLQCVMERYRKLFPGWEISLISIEKDGDRNCQLDAMIALLQK